MKNTKLEKIQWINAPKDIPDNIVALNRIALLISFIMLNTKEDEREILKKPDTFQNYVNRYQKICDTLKDTEDFKNYFLLNQDNVKEFVGDDFLIKIDNGNLKQLRTVLVNNFLKYGKYSKNRFSTVVRCCIILGIPFCFIGICLIMGGITAWALPFFTPLAVGLVSEILIQFLKFKIYYFIPTQLCMNSFDDEFTKSFDVVKSYRKSETENISAKDIDTSEHKNRATSFSNELNKLCKDPNVKSEAKVLKETCLTFLNDFDKLYDSVKTTKKITADVLAFAYLKILELHGIIIDEKLSYNYIFLSIMGTTGKISFEKYRFNNCISEIKNNKIDSDKILEKNQEIYNFLKSDLKIVKN